MSARAIPLALRAPIAACAALALVSGVLAGLVRAGWGVPLPASAIMAHGPLLAVGFFGTLIGLERAVAVGHLAALVPPVLAAASGVAMVLGAPIAPVLATASGLAALVLHGWLLARSPSLDLAMLTLGALAWALGNVAWLAGRTIADASLGWSAFLVLTIVGERLEMTRLLPPRRGRTATLAAAVALLVVGSASAVIEPGLGAWARGAGLAAMGLWLLAHDAVLRVRAPGTPPYLKTALALGHPWLVIAAPLVVLAGGDLAGLRYDAALHAIYAGFVLGMVLAHAPIVLGAVLKVRLAPPPFLYVPLVLLHGATATRVAGDLLGEPSLRGLGALASALALVVFASTIVVSLLAHRRARAADRDGLSLGAATERSP
ncbi:hypothetical protein [Sandaracinus amylolyticus]|uniref:hypothetical protein n=1 Tax=Sandaracinus amylolyticus TaxID=927083 RepID=UPI001F2406F4|nr:hypothetical protein [Sandaracinus amylolyticus]UJR84121.1 Hypothetical protein I5071_61920 [Sandaracinus amylolyticus]